MRYFLQIYRNKYAFAFLALVFVLAIITLIFFNNPFKISRADSIASLDGWAWSSNIGWVSLNCQDRSVCSTSDYKVQVNPSDGKLKGYAWSSNIGWIQFDPTGSYPESPQTSAVIDLTTGKASGWLRALSYDHSYDDGWDGWIKITDAKVNNGKFEGWAWGGLVVGWLNFWNVNIPNINVQCSFDANPSSIVSPQTSTLSWACQYAASCSIDQGIGSVDNVSGTKSVQPSETTTYTLTCSGLGGPSVKSVTVSVKNVQCDFSANPYSIVRPQTSTFSWVCQYATSCSIDQGIGSVDNASGTKSVQPSKTTTYTLTCSGPGGPSVKSATVNVSMPKIEIKEVAP